MVCAFRDVSCDCGAHGQFRRRTEREPLASCSRDRSCYCRVRLGTRRVASTIHCLVAVRVARNFEDRENRIQGNFDRRFLTGRGVSYWGTGNGDERARDRYRRDVVDELIATLNL